MKIKTSQFTVAIVCALLGFMLTYQFKLLNKKNDLELISSNKYNNNEILTEIDKLKKSKQDIEKKNNELLDQIKKYEETAANSDDMSKELKSQLDNTRLLLGFTDVEGPGITVTLTPKESLFSSDVAQQYIDHTELSYLVNELNFAGAEAISINDLRITTQTGIKTASNYIIINDEKISPSSKITINAIGDKINMEKGLNFTGVLSYGALGYYDITIEKSDMIKIPKYNKAYKYDYLKPIDK